MGCDADDRRGLEQIEAETGPLRQLKRACVVILAVAATTTSSASGQTIQKCVDEIGRVVYQDAPCSSGRAVAQLQRDQTKPDPAVTERAALARMTPEQREAWLRFTPYERQILGEDGVRYFTIMRSSNDHESLCRISGEILRKAVIRSDAMQRLWRRFNEIDCEAAAERRRMAAAAAMRAPPVRIGIDNKSRAGERRFITLHGNRFAEDEIRGRLGDPDSTSYGGGVSVWIYEPTDADQQTRTAIYFRDGVMVDVKREVRH